MSPRAYLTVRPLSFGYAVPQQEGVAWMQEALGRVAAEQPLPDLRRALRFYRLLARATTIGSRTTCLEDYTHQDWSRMRLMAPPHAGDGALKREEASRWYRPALERRMAVFAETADRLAREAFASDVESPDVLMQVSCTGYSSPTAVQRLAVEKGWTGGAGGAPRLVHIGHMGCYAAIPAASLAADAVHARSAAFVGVEEETARAAIFLVELCTLHHDPSTTDVEQIVQQCLFADGAARVDVASTQPPGRSLALVDTGEALIPGTEDAMTWGLADSAFKMTLSRDVPRHIQEHLAATVGAFLGRHGLTASDVPWWAIHPGGPRVIESSAEALGLSEQSIAHSQAVLYARGNMSSTTLPHIWASLLDDEQVEKGDLVVSLAFGPGLTVAMNLMQVA